MTDHSTILFIGDPHFQVSACEDVERFIIAVSELAEERLPDLIIIAGDILHNHERIHTTALNMAYSMVDRLRVIAHVMILVGNHDYCSNSQFLTDKHWMNAMKKWSNVTIVDTVVRKTVGDSIIVCVPYVPPGRFEDALDTQPGGWRDADVIFAHSEFKGCKMGAIISIEGDNWPLDNPSVVSGHIHDRQTPQPNVYYPGSAMQNAFGESGHKVIPILTMNPDSDLAYDLEEVDLRLPGKKTVYMTADDIEGYVVPETNDRLKVSVSGDYSDFKALKKSKKYKELVERGVKVVFKPTKAEVLGGDDVPLPPVVESAAFITILDGLINAERDPILHSAYSMVVHSREEAVLYV